MGFAGKQLELNITGLTELNHLESSSLFQVFVSYINIETDRPK